MRTVLCTMPLHICPWRLTSPYAPQQLAHYPKAAISLQTCPFPSSPLHCALCNSVYVSRLKKCTGSSFATNLCLQVVGFPDRVAANNFMLLNPNRVTAAVHLDVTEASDVGFTLQTNSTVCCLSHILLATHLADSAFSLQIYSFCHL